MASFSFLKPKVLALLLALALLFTQQCHAGYAIQDDCSEAQRAFLVKAFASAHTLASLAEANTVEGYSREGTQVFEWLFGTDRLDLMRTSVQIGLRGISENATPVQGEPKGGDDLATDVRVFCTHNRLREGRVQADGSKRIFDPATKEFLKSKLDCINAFAFTILPAKADLEQPDTIQICPWFLDYGMKQNAQFQSQFTPGKIASMIVNLKMDKIATWGMYTPVDLFQLFDKVIVHELSHTRRARRKIDVGGFAGYGWKNCRKLSTERGRPKDPQWSPQWNADSFALFASISGLIQAGGMVNEDGSFVRGASHAPKRRSFVPNENGEAELVPAVVKKRALRFDTLSLKGRSLL